MLNVNLEQIILAHGCGNRYFDINRKLLCRVDDKRSAGSGLVRKPLANKRPMKPQILSTCDSFLAP